MKYLSLRLAALSFTALSLTALSLSLAAAPMMAERAIAQEMRPKAAGDAVPVMVIDRQSFVTTVKSANAFEIQSSELAKEAADNAGIKKSTDMIIADHRKAGDKLKATLEAKGAAPSEPAKPASKHQKMLDQLKGAKGKDFDMLYLDMQAQAHMEAIALFRTYAGSGDDQVLVGFAKETLPTLETHLGHVKMLIAGE